MYWYNDGAASAGTQLSLLDPLVSFFDGGSNLGHTFRPTPNCTSSDPSQIVLFARSLEYFKSIELQPQYKVSPIKSSWAYFMYGDKFIQANKSIVFDRIKRPKFGMGSGELYFSRGVG